MEIVIIGFPGSGKTTVFHALSRGAVSSASRHTIGLQPVFGVVKVPDPRLEVLADIFHPKRLVQADVQYVDVAGTSRMEGSPSGIDGELLNLLQAADSLLHVVRGVATAQAPSEGGRGSPEEQMAAMEAELAFTDLGIVERRLQRLTENLKSAKPQERPALTREKELLLRVQEGLEQGRALRDQSLSLGENKTLENYRFLTAKPLLVVLNVEEGYVDQVSALERELSAKAARPGRKLVALCGKIEKELAELPTAEEQEFRSSLGLVEAGWMRVVRATYDLLGLVSFFTFASSEVRVWPVPRDTPAQKAAGKIHTDMERGFIRAEVVSFADLAQYGSLAEARKRGLLRLEGKSYPVKDGDVITFLFSV